MQWFVEIRCELFEGLHAITVNYKFHLHSCCIQTELVSDVLPWCIGARLELGRVAGNCHLEYHHHRRYVRYSQGFRLAEDPERSGTQR